MSPMLLKLGNLEVYRVPEVTVAYAPTFLFKALPQGFIDSHRDALPAWSAERGSERIYLSFQSFLVRHAGRTILVDTCNGNHKDRPGMPRWHQTEFPYLQRLADAGVTPAQVDIVLCSHLHADHVGWNTRLENGRWVPTFPNARYLVSDIELAHWQDQGAQNASRPLNHGSYQDSVLPILEAGLLDAVSADHTVSRDVDAHLSLELAPGHTPGHVHLVMRSRGHQLIYAADTIHHPLQVAHPQYGLTDGDAVLAEQTRRELIARCAASGATLLPAHFEHAGTIHHHQGGAVFRTLDL